MAAKIARFNSVNSEITGRKFIKFGHDVPCLLPWQRPLKNKKLNGVIKPFHLTTNPEILVKIGPLASEPAWLRGRPRKKK